MASIIVLSNHIYQSFERSSCIVPTMASCTLERSECGLCNYQWSSQPMSASSRAGAHNRKWNVVTHEYLQHNSNIPFPTSWGQLNDVKWIEAGQLIFSDRIKKFQQYQHANYFVSSTNITRQFRRWPWLSSRDINYDTMIVMIVIVSRLTWDPTLSTLLISIDIINLFWCQLGVSLARGGELLFLTGQV